MRRKVRSLWCVSSGRLGVKIPPIFFTSLLSFTSSFMVYPTA